MSRNDGQDRVASWVGLVERLVALIRVYEVLLRAEPMVMRAVTDTTLA